MVPMPVSMMLPTRQVLTHRHLQTTMTMPLGLTPTCPTTDPAVPLLIVETLQLTPASATRTTVALPALLERRVRRPTAWAVLAPTPLVQMPTQPISEMLLETTILPEQMSSNRQRWGPMVPAEMLLELMPTVMWPHQGRTKGPCHSVDNAVREATLFFHLQLPQ